MTIPTFSAVLRALVPRRQAVGPRESLAAQPRAYQVCVIVRLAAVIVGTVVAWPRIIPVDAVVIIVACVFGDMFVPVDPSPSGGIVTFLTPTFAVVGLLYDPATAFVGIAIGWGFGHTIFHRRELWRGMSNGFNAAVGTAIGAVVVTSLRTSLPLAAAAPLAPMVMVATRHIVNTMLTTITAHARWALPPWPYFMSEVTNDIAEHALDVIWLLPIVAGSVVFARDQWWILLLASLALSAIKPAVDSGRAPAENDEAHGRCGWAPSYR